MENYNPLKTTLDEIKKQRIKIYHVLTMALDAARTDFEIAMTGSYLYVLVLNGTATIKLNEQSGDSFSLLTYRTVKAPFYRLFLSNTTQPGKVLTLAVGVEELNFSIQDFGVTFTGSMTIAQDIVQRATVPFMTHVVCTLTATEYSQGLSVIKKFTIKARGGRLQVSFITGQTANDYILLEDGQSYSEDLIYLTAFTLFFESPTAGAIAEIIAWQ